MNASAVVFLPHQIRGILLEQFWCAVDDKLASLGQASACWLEELSEPYAAGLSVDAAVRMILAGRRRAL